MRFEKDPALHSTYRRSLERTWELLRIQHVPRFNFVYGALTGKECEVQPAVAHLREWALDLVVYSFQNSHRTDLKTPAGYEARKGGARAFSPREPEPMRWDHWSMEAGSGAGGRDVVEPSAWLMAHWMGRYYGFSEAPGTTDPASRLCSPWAPAPSIPTARGHTTDRRGRKTFDRPEQLLAPIQGGFRSQARRTRSVQGQKASKPTKMPFRFGRRTCSEEPVAGLWPPVAPARPGRGRSLELREPHQRGSDS